jgi:hypothetical protein
VAKFRPGVLSLIHQAAPRMASFFQQVASGTPPMARATYGQMFSSHSLSASETVNSVRVHGTAWNTTAPRHFSVTAPRSRPFFAGGPRCTRRANDLIDTTAAVEVGGSRIYRRPRLGGLLNYYARAV